MDKNYISCISKPPIIPTKIVKNLSLSICNVAREDFSIDILLVSGKKEKDAK